MKLIDILPQNCTGCRLCEMMCSLAHEGECSTARSRVKVYRDEEFGNNLISLCTQCEEAYCVQSCGYGALSRDAITGAVVVDRHSCNACEACILVCPAGAICLDGNGKVVLKCDLCGGDPECVKVCTPRALSVKEGEPGAPERKALLHQISERRQSIRSARAQGV